MDLRREQGLDILCNICEADLTYVKGKQNRCNLQQEEFQEVQQEGQSRDLRKSWQTRWGDLEQRYPIRSNPRLTERIILSHWLEATWENHGFPSNTEADTEGDKEKLKFYITSCSFCLCNQLAPCKVWIPQVIQSQQVGTQNTGAYLTHPCPALCNRPAPANLLNHACPCKGQVSPSPS